MLATAVTSPGPRSGTSLGGGGWPLGPGKCPVTSVQCRAAAVLTQAADTVVRYNQMLERDLI